MINVWAKLILQQESYELYVSHSIFNIYSNNKGHLGGGGREGGDSDGNMMILVEETWLLSSWSVASCQPHWDT